MSFEASWYYQVTNTAAISAIIGARFYPGGAVPQGAALPYAAYWRTDRDRERHQGGTSNLSRAVCEVQCWATTQLGARALSDAFVTAFDDYRGAIGAAGAQTTIRQLTFESDRDEWTEPSDGGEETTHCVAVSFTAFYVES